MKSSLTNYRAQKLFVPKKAEVTGKSAELKMSSDSLRLVDLPQVRKKFTILINDINQYKSRVQQARDKVNTMLYSKQEFQAASFEKYIASKAKGLDQTNREYKVSLTTKHCRLSNSKIQLERFATPQSKILKSDNIFARPSNLNLNRKLKEANSNESNPNASPVKEGHTERKKNRLENTFKSIFLGVKGRSGFRNSIALKRAEASSLREKIKQSEFAFKEDLNQKLLMNFFYYHLKMNNKAGVIRALNAYPKLVSLVDKFGKYPIHYSSNRSLCKMTKILISFGSPIDVKDKLGNLPLDYAYANKNVKLLKVR